jgi:hypothetical protein
VSEMDLVDAIEYPILSLLSTLNLRSFTIVSGLAPERRINSVRYPTARAAKAVISFRNSVSWPWPTSPDYGVQFPR